MISGDLGDENFNIVFIDAEESELSSANCSNSDDDENVLNELELVGIHDKKRSIEKSRFTDDCIKPKTLEPKDKTKIKSSSIYEVGSATKSTYSCGSSLVFKDDFDINKKQLKTQNSFLNENKKSCNTNINITGQSSTSASTMHNSGINETRFNFNPQALNFSNQALGYFSYNSGQQYPYSNNSFNPYLLSSNQLQGQFLYRNSFQNYTNNPYQSYYPYLNAGTSNRFESINLNSSNIQKEKLIQSPIVTSSMSLPEKNQVQKQRKSFEMTNTTKTSIVDSSKSIFTKSFKEETPFAKMKWKDEPSITKPQSTHTQLNISTLVEKGNLAETINSQKGSKKLQKYLASLGKDDSEISVLFQSVLPSLGKITNHNFGNYFCQILLQRINLTERQQAWKFYTRRNLLDYSLHHFGYHSILCLISAVECLSEETFVISQLEKHFNMLSFHQNGSHILQKLLNVFHEENLQSLIFYVKVNFYSLASNGIACSLTKRFFNFWALQKLDLKIDFINYSLKWLPILICDKYGHSSIMSLIDEWEVNACIQIFEVIKQNLVYYIKNKYSQLVVSKCLDILPDKVRCIYFI